MNKGTASWLLLLLAGILLIVIGAEGALGLVVAVAFSPGSIAVYGDTKSL